MKHYIKSLFTLIWLNFKQKFYLTLNEGQSKWPENRKASDQNTITSLKLNWISFNFIPFDSSFNALSKVFWFQFDSLNRSTEKREILARDLHGPRSLVTERYPAAYKSSGGWWVTWREVETRIIKIHFGKLKPEPWAHLALTDIRRM